MNMFKSIAIFFICVTSQFQLTAQLFPQEGNQLCYRIIGFSFPAQTGAVKYKLEIAKGNYNSEDLFIKNLATSKFCKTNKLIAEVPSFGCEYTWRIISVTKGNITTKGMFHHFIVKYFSDLDPVFSRVRIIKDAVKHKDAYVFIDNSKMLYDMKGHPVWFLPGADLNVNKRAFPRDIKATSSGTITFFTGHHPYEINYNGDIIWNYQNDTNIARVHHEFTRLSNGHYMALVLENASGHFPVFTSEDQSHVDIYDSAGFYRSNIYNSIAEFDYNNKLIWRWSGMNYIYNSDLRLRQTADIPNYIDDDLHENSFFFDEKNKVIYLSFRNINRIIKIKYPEGNIINTYGTQYKPGTKNIESKYFCHQHSCKRSQKGYLYLYNNNICDGKQHIPTIVMYQEPAPGKNDLKKVWEYQCTVEGIDSSALAQAFFYGGGSVMELSDQSMLVMMGIPYPKLFIVSHDKKILWSAICEKYDLVKKKWGYSGDYYRASLISRKELEQMIWGSEK